MNKLIKGDFTKKWLSQHLELIFWVSAICLLFFMDTSASQPSLCIYRLVGFDSCPGCGLGHAMYHAMHLNFMQSIDEHKFGIPAVFIISLRIKQLLFPKKTTVYEV